MWLPLLQDDLGASWGARCWKRADLNTSRQAISAALVHVTCSSMTIILPLAQPALNDRLDT